MTHLSDFSYLQRVALEIYMGFFLFHRIWTNDRFKCLHPKRVFAGELRSVITVLYLMMLVMQTTWDIISTWIKYNEEFYVIPGTEKIITKPFSQWTPQHQNIAQAMDYVECVNLSMQTGVFFLLQCFWNYLSNSVAKRSFMSSLEFKFYIFWALGSVAVFPILQWYFRKDEHLRETAPQLAYSIEVLITVILGVRSHKRFKRILKASLTVKHGSTIIEKLAYFKDMNVFLTAILFFYGTSLCILCVDGLTTAKLINSNKFASDLLIANCNTCSVLMWLVGISIFHPRRSYQEIEASMHSNSMSNNNTTAHRIAPDIEMSNKSNSNNGSSDNSTKVNGKRLSQRITNFIENKNGNGAPRFSSNNENGGFVRAMSPVQPDYPTNRSYTPTHQFSTTKNIAVVDDPYTNTPINFTMMDSKRYNESTAGRDSYERSNSPGSARHRQQQDTYPMQTMSSVVSSQQQEDFRFDPALDNYDYMTTTKNSYYSQTPGGRI